MNLHNYDYRRRLVYRYEISEYVPLVVITIRFFPHSSLITRMVNRVTRQLPL